jgi:hypothetical protein
MALNQSRAEERKGRRIRTVGRVKPWSWTSSGGGASGSAFAARVRRSLFLRTRRRFLQVLVSEKLKREITKAGY